MRTLRARSFTELRDLNEWCDLESLTIEQIYQVTQSSAFNSVKQIVETTYTLWFWYDLFRKEG
jgi:hypothetical protein